MKKSHLLAQILTVNISSCHLSTDVSVLCREPEAQLQFLRCQALQEVCVKWMPFRTRSCSLWSVTLYFSKPELSQKQPLASDRGAWCSTASVFFKSFRSLIDSRTWNPLRRVCVRVFWVNKEETASPSVPYPAGFSPAALDPFLPWRADSGGPHCSLCPDAVESLNHIRASLLLFSRFVLNL